MNRKKEIKRITAFILAAVMIFSLVTFDSDFITDAQSNDKSTKIATLSDADGELSLAGDVDEIEDENAPNVVVEDIDLSSNDNAFKTDDDLIVLKSGTILQVQVTATDTETGIAKVECYKDGEIYDTADVDTPEETADTTFDIKDAGEYTFIAYDVSGNASDETEAVVIDILKAPVLDTKLTAGAAYKSLGSHNMLLNTSSFDIEITATSKTENGVDVTKYTGLQLLYQYTGGSIQTVDLYDADENTAEYKLTVPQEKSKATLSLYVKDIFGNDTDIYSSTGNLIFIDDDEPEVNIVNVYLDGVKYSYEDYLDLSDKWAADVAVDITVKEDASYIKSVSYDVDGTNTRLTDNADEYQYNIAALNISDGLSTGEHTFTVNADNYLEKSKTSDELIFYIDKSGPNITVNSGYYGKDTEDISDNNKYLYSGNNYYVVSGNSGETLTISADDIYSGTSIGSGVDKVTISVNGEVQTITPDVNGNYELKVTSSGFYNVVVNVSDNAGNPSSKDIYLVIDNSTIDKSIKITATDTSGETKTYDSSELIYFGKDISEITVEYKASGFGVSVIGPDSSNTDKSDVSYYSPNGTTATSKYGDVKTDISGTIENTEITQTYTLTTSDAVQGKYVVNFVTGKSVAATADTVSETVTFIYDSTAPSVTAVSFTNAAGSYTDDEGVPVYVYKSGSTVAPKIQLDCQDAYSIDSYVIKDANGNTLAEGTANVTGTSDKDAVEYSKTITLPVYKYINDGSMNTNEIYSISLQVSDKSGNVGEAESGDTVGSGTSQMVVGKFVVDSEAPTVSFAAVNYYNSSNVTLTFTASDNIYCSGSGILYRVNNGSYHEIAAISDGKTIKGTLPFTEEGKYEVSLRVKDLAGNVSTWAKTSFIIDKTGAKVTVTGIPANGLSQGTTVKFQLTDNFEISPSDFTLTMHCITVDNNRTDTAIKLNQNGTYGLIANVPCNQMSGKACYYWFTLSGKDKSGNIIYGTSKSNGIYTSEDFFVDNTVPVISISPVPAQTNSGYYNTSVSFNINVVEQYDKFAGKVVITDANGAVNGDTTDSRTATSKNAKYTVSRSKQGIYNLTVTATDAFGNTSSKNVSFVIDKEKPVITLGQVDTSSSGSVTLPVTITDKYKGDTYVVHVTRKNASGTVVYDADEPGKWDGTRKVLNPTFTEEGDYTVSVTAKDKAGNEAVVQTRSFRIDKTAPVLSITGVNDTQTAGCTATLSINEAFSFTYDGASSSASVTITKRTDGTGESTIATMDLGNFSAGNPHTASYSFSEDGEYTITMSATDACGNTAAQITKTFKVDSTAPVIAAATRDKNNKAVNSYATVGSSEGEDANYVVMDIDITEAFYSSNDVSFVVMKDGKDVSSEYFGGYANRAEVSSVQQRFDQDGVYTITVNAKDSLGNEAEEYSIVFTLDNTAPTVNSTTVQAEFRNKADENGDILLNASDFEDIKDMGYEALWTVNDTSIFTVDCKMDGVELVDFTDLQDGYHKIVITVTDEVGHITVKEFEFTYDGTAPRILITGIDDGETVNEAFTLGISLENNEDTITSIIINGEAIDPALFEETNSYEMQVTEYDDYEIQVEAADLAGNTASTFNESTGKYFSFTLREKLSPILLIIIILIVIILIALLIFIIARSRKKDKK